MSTFADALAAFRAGDPARAEALAAARVAVQPDELDSHLLLGQLRLQRGAAAEAFAAFDIAVGLDPEFGPAWANRASALAALGRSAEALASAERAVSLRPDLAPAWLLAARLHAVGGSFAPARDAARRALALPGAPRAAHRVLAASLEALSEPGASSAWAAALVAEPSALAAAGLARSRWAEGLDPLPALVDGVSRFGPDPDLVALLAEVLPARDDLGPDGVGVLVRLASSKDVDLQPFERPLCRAVLAGEVGLRAAWLERTLAIGPEAEAWLSATRRAALEDAAAGRSVDEALLASLAVQAFWREHAILAGPDERPRLAGLAHPARALVAATYDPPAGEDGLPPALRRTLLDEPREEEALRDEIASLSPVIDATSHAVAAMYEENPYPRLVSWPSRPPTSLADEMRSAGASFPPGARHPVLVAGAGTGRHALMVASRYHDADVLGIDLSRASLARAAAVARRSGVRLEWMVGDLLDVAHLGRTFHHVEAAGVLHHLREPAAGWRALVSVLAPGATMRVAVYSTRGRSEIPHARAVCADLPTTPEGLDEARRRLLALPDDHPARPVVHSPDFASRSGLRDLVLHVCEHTTSLPDVGVLAASLSLDLLRVAARPHAARLYRERWPDDREQRDLQRWDELEALHPRIFSGMFVVLFTRRASPP